MLRSDAIVTKDMASVAKWLRQWFVVPPFVGSIPIIRPFNSELLNSIARGLYGTCDAGRVCTAHLNLVWDLAVVSAQVPMC